MGSFRLGLVALLLCGVATGCEWTDETASFRTEDLTSYSQEIERGRQQPWADTPRHMVEHFIGPPISKEQGPVTYQEVRHLNGVVTLTVTREGLLDDELYAERRVFTFVRNHGQWALQQVKVDEKCNRYSAYSGRNCAKW